MLIILCYASSVGEEQDKRTTSNKEHYTMSIKMTSFDVMRLSAGFPIGEEAVALDNMFFRMQKLCDLAYIYLPMLTALYVTYQTFMEEAKGEEVETLSLNHFLQWINTGRHAIGLKQVFQGADEHRMAVGGVSVLRKEFVFELFVANEHDGRTIGYVSIIEERYIEDDGGLIRSSYLYFDKLN